MTADLKTDGNVPVESELLKRIVIKGEMMDAHSLSNHVGMGSSSDCLLEVRRMMEVTSLQVTGEKDANLCDVAVNAGSSASTVFTLMSATFLMKKSCS